MFDNFITRITSPSSRRRHTYHCPPQEVHSDPEDNDVRTGNNASCRRPRLLEKRKKGRSRANVGLRQARSLGRLDGLKEAEKLADFGRHLSNSEMILDNGRHKDLDRIQDLFPYDHLGLHIADPISSNLKKSFRKKSLNDLNISCNRNESKEAIKRLFLIEAPCAMSLPHLPSSAKPRHLFLFSDLLLVAKPRSSGTFKLKECVRVSELWLAPWSESETGFLLGWPSPAQTYLVIFCTQAARDTWWRQLQQSLQLQLRLEPAITNIKVVYKDPTNGVECSKTLSIGPEMSSMDVARLALDDATRLRGGGGGGGDWTYTLYAKDRDSTPCPLIGCERPHSIQLSRLRQSLCTEEGFDLVHCNKINRIPNDIVFELKPIIKLPTIRKTPLKLFRKTSSRIFGLPLSRLCPNNTLPPVIMACLRALFHRGPHTQGIFRRCASARALRELRHKIDLQQSSTVCEEITNTPALLLAALLKDFLRSLPEPLLSGSVQEWLNVVVVAASNGNRIDHLRCLINQLPRENLLLLSYVVCVLYAIAKRSRYNLMSAANLGVCVGPSLLWEPTQNAPLRTLPTLVETLITNCQHLFGPQVVSLLGEVAHDSGAEESDSLHSLGLSLDSVELSKDQKSLSRDSGLTLSEDDRDSPGLYTNYPVLTQQQQQQQQPATFHRFDWTRQAARCSNNNRINETHAWIEEDDEVFCTSNENLCGPPVPPRRPPPLRHLPPVPPRRPPPLRHLPPVHLPPMYRPPPPPPPAVVATTPAAASSAPIYATAKMLLVTDVESESYV